MEKEIEADWRIISQRPLFLFVIVVIGVVEEVRDLVLLVGDEVGAGFEEAKTGSANFIMNNLWLF